MQQPSPAVDREPLKGARIGVVADAYDELEGIEAALRQAGADVVRIPLRRTGLRGVDDTDLLLVHTPRIDARNGELALLATLASRQRVIALVDLSRSLVVHGLRDLVFAPFRPEEIVARVGRALAEPAPPLELRAGNLTLHLLNHTVAIAGERVPLTLQEFEVLRLLLTANGAVLSREDITHHLGHDDSAVGRAVDINIHRLRAKLSGLGGAAIDTVRGVGYRLSRT